MADKGVAVRGGTWDDIVDYEDAREEEADTERGELAAAIPSHARRAKRLEEDEELCEEGRLRHLLRHPPCPEDQQQEFDLLRQGVLELYPRCLDGRCL